jgi:hypothetical protein
MFNFKLDSVIDRDGIGRFIKIYARKDLWHNQDRKNGNLGYGWLHYALIRNFRPKRILCIGSKYGFVPAICAVGCRDNKFGKVDFVDAGMDMDLVNKLAGDHWGGVGLWKKCRPEKYFGKFGIEKYINLYVMKDLEFAKKYSKRKYDYIHIDGDHSYKGVKKDFSLFWKRLNRGGFMAFHDIASPDRDGNVYGTRDFWKELKEKYKVTFEFNKDPGVGIIQKL